ncbi:MAG: thiamine pyrophosphate-dependent enzyme, partial [Chloroflexi bacterium]|nr:thiamine pyrophosphate-dependent enzyme [Chloroflexota bacterium]
MLVIEEHKDAISTYGRDELLRMHYQMLLVRRFEERVGEMYLRAKIGGYCHLNLGEEAAVVGSTAALENTDYIFTSYREHGNALARGLSPSAIMAELFGKVTGVCQGRGGSMHLYDAKQRFMGGY